jgi:hypothetical protein
LKIRNPSGYAVVRIYFHSNVKIDMAVAQTVPLYAYFKNGFSPAARNYVKPACSTNWTEFSPTGRSEFG